MARHLNLSFGTPASSTDSEPQEWETTVTLLSGVIYYLFKSPAVMERLVTGIRTSFVKEEGITLINVANLKYMLVVLDEGMRIYPPMPVDLRRSIPAGGSVICGKWDSLKVD